MNLMEHYIIDVYSVVDVTEELKQHGIDSSEDMLKVDVLYDCYGIKERRCVTMSKSKWEEAKTNGYFLA